MSLRASLNEALLVISDNDLEVTLAWFGGSYVRVFEDSGNELSSWSVELKEWISPREQIKKSMMDHIKDYYYP